MAQRVQHLSVGSIEFAANQQRDLKLPDTGWIDRLILKLTGQPTISSTNNTAAKAEAGDGMAVIDQLEILAGTTPVRRLSGYQLAVMNALLHDSPVEASNVGDGTTANPTFNHVFPVHTTIPAIDKPFMSRLEANRVDQPTLRVHWADYDDVSSDASAWTSDPVLYVDAVIHEPILSEVNGKVRPMRAIPNLVYHWRTVDIGSGESVFNLPTNFVYRGILLRTHNSGVDAELLQNRIKIETPGYPFYDRLAATIQQQTKLLHRDRSFSWDFNSHDVDLDGWYFLDLLSDSPLNSPGMISEALPTVFRNQQRQLRQLNQLTLTVDGTTASRKMDVILMVTPNPGA